MTVLFNQFKRAHSKSKVKDPEDSRTDPRTDSFSPSALPPSRFPLADYDPISISHSRSPFHNFAEEDSVDTVVITHTAFPRTNQDSAGRSSRKTGIGSINTTNGSNDFPKKVAFSPPPPPSPLGLNAGRPLPQDASTSNNSAVVRWQSSRPKDPRGYTSTAGSWSEGVEEDLVAHLGSHERTRQEVLWEIVVNEERYSFYPCCLNKNKSVNCLADMSPSCSRRKTHL